MSVWVKQDFTNGWCLEHQIGQPIEPFIDKIKIESERVKSDPDTDTAAALDIPPMTSTERKAITQRIHDQALRAIASDTEGMISDSASVVNKILEQSARLLEKEEERADVIGEMSEKELEAIATNDLKRYFIRHPTEDSTPEYKVQLAKEISQERCRLCGGKPFK